MSLFTSFSFIAAWHIFWQSQNSFFCLAMAKMFEKLLEVLTQFWKFSVFFKIL